LIAFIDPRFENAARLGLGTISACWLASTSNDNGNNFDLTTQIRYFYSDGSVSNEQIATANGTDTNVLDCAGTPDPTHPFKPDVLATVIQGWMKGGSNNCPDVSTVLGGTNLEPSDGVQAATSAVASELSTLRKTVYNHIITGGAGLIAGDSQATNVQQAATRLDGANELLDGYVSLGLPQALSSDDALKGLVSGTNSDTFAPGSGGLAGAVPASGVAAQVVNLYKAAINDDAPSPTLPVIDAADVAATLVDQRASQLATALNAHIVPAGAQGAARQGHVRLSAQIVAPQTSSTVFAEENPYIGPTLDRLDETALVLNDEMSGPGTTPGAPATPGTPRTPARPGTATAPATPTSPRARCTVKAAGNKVLLAARKGKPGLRLPKPGTLTLTVRCARAGKVRLTGTLTQLIGRKPAHGKEKTKTYKLGPVNRSLRAGRAVTLQVKLPAAAVSALAGGAKESATFTVVLTGRGGAPRGMAKITTLKAIR
jgi:hypothetical protein